MNVTQEFIQAWHQFTRDYKLHLEEHLAPSLTEGQLVVLEYVLSREEDVKASDLLGFLATSPAAVTTLLDRMEKNGLIERERNERDRRIVWIRPTAKGRSETERGIRIRDAYVEERLDRISRHNQQLLVLLLGKLKSDPAPASTTSRDALEALPQ